jgi:hypothetical protein
MGTYLDVLYTKLVGDMFDMGLFGMCVPKGFSHLVVVLRWTKGE